MKIATFALVALVTLAAVSIGAPMKEFPDNKIVVVRVTSVNGFARWTGETTETRSSVFSYDGFQYHIDKSALPSVDGIKTLVLIDRREDEMSGESMLRKFEQEVRAFGTTSFEVNDISGKVLSYQAAMIGGNLRLLGDGDQISAWGGPGGPYQIWKVTGIDLIDPSSFVLN